jgi:hypothetical protein
MEFNAPARGVGVVDRLAARSPPRRGFGPLTSASVPGVGLVRRVDLAMTAWRAMAAWMILVRDPT